MFSIIVPVYNKEPHLRRSINSILGQSYPFFELILVDDGSTDNSLKVLRSFKDERIRIFRRSEPGSGGYAARNLAIKKAKFNWIAFLDADDEWELTRLEKILILSRSFPDAKLLSSGWKEYFNEDKILFDDFSDKYSISPPRYFDIYTLLLDKQPICTSVAVVQKELLLSVNGFDEHWKRGADLELWLRLLLTGVKGAWLNEATATYYKNSSNMVTLTNPFIESPVFRTIKERLVDENDSELALALKKFGNRINYGVGKSLLLKERSFRQYLAENLFFDFRIINKVLLATLIVLCLPRKISYKLMKKGIL